MTKSVKYPLFLQHFIDKIKDIRNISKKRKLMDVGEFVNVNIDIFIIIRGFKIRKEAWTILLKIVHVDNYNGNDLYRRTGNGEKTEPNALLQC